MESMNLTADTTSCSPLVLCLAAFHSTLEVDYGPLAVITIAIFQKHGARRWPQGLQEIARLRPENLTARGHSQAHEPIADAI